MVVNCIFHLENSPDAIFFAGQELKGQVELTLDRPKTVRNLNLVINGFAYCHWTESHTETVGTGENRRTETRTTHYEGKEVYLNSITYLYGSSGGSSQEMAAGTYRYDFQVHLPENLPASFEASLGHIRYFIEVEMDIPWGIDKDYKLPFTVVRSDDLNFYPELQYPVQDEETKTFCCFCCASEPVVIKVSIPHSGFGVGQIIPVKIEYYNQSDVDIEDTTVCLRREIRFHSHTPHSKTNHETERIEEVYTGGALKLSNKIHEAALKIPSLLAKSNGKFCNVVEVSYHLKVISKVSGCHTNVEFTLPITIGTIGYGCDATYDGGLLPPSVVSNGNQEDIIDPSAPPDFDSIFENGALDLPTPPPTFDEATKKPSSNGFPDPSPSIGWNFGDPSASAGSSEAPSAPVDDSPTKEKY